MSEERAGKKVSFFMSFVTRALKSALKINEEMEAV